MLQLSKSLVSKAITLHSTTIDSPTERTNNDGVAIRPTVYFDKPVTKDGKLVPGKKSTLYTPDAGEAAELKCNQDSCESVMLDGSGKYNPENELHYRFLKSALTPADVKEIKSVKGLLSCNKSVVKVKTALKACVSQYILGLPNEQRSIFAEALASITLPVIDRLRNEASDDTEDSPLFS